MLMEKMSVPVNVFGDRMMGDKNIWGIAPTLPEEFYVLPDAEPGLTDMLKGGGFPFRFGMGGAAPSSFGGMLDWAKSQPLPKQEIKMAADQFAGKNTDDIFEYSRPNLEKMFPETNWNDYSTNELRAKNQVRYGSSNVSPGFGNSRRSTPVVRAPLSGVGSGRSGLSFGGY